MVNQYELISDPLRTVTITITVTIVLLEFSLGWHNLTRQSNLYRPTGSNISKIFLVGYRSLLESTRSPVVIKTLSNCLDSVLNA